MRQLSALSSRLTSTLTANDHPALESLSARSPPWDVYRIKGKGYDVVVNIGDYAIFDMMREMVTAFIEMGFLDPPDPLDTSDLN